ncbi:MULTISPECIES: head GIN domain-containing protein [unclassified Cellulophaga]|uniref:head GIN domain-containing protein n=1 Tax=unclassified Cellulophaga TaxID=2634405 RepID=UPI0026E42821|nr:MULTISPECIES: head GIN domain-containing protein [unclassified Cellulophaga]MDO6491366.1 head GIN domain-containing protein [Cellulophaga sp. 2_MG-2023]MDO6495101.1 head GIN domain-containing protein [Cellulophaga sp. 3_MG-2023]
MNKLTLFTFLLFTFSLVNAQNEKITLQLESFTEVKAFDGLSVNLIKSTKNEAVITGANTQKVSIVNNDGVLKLRMQLDKIFSGYRTFVDVYYTDILAVIDVNEDARISSNETIKQDLLELKSQEGGELIIDVEVTQLLIKSVTGGVITSKGSAKNQDIKINTGGIYYGKNLKTELTTISVNAGGNAEINATNYVQATVKAGGEVLVYGDPLKMDEKTVFGGKIIRK